MQGLGVNLDSLDDVGPLSSNIDCCCGRPDCAFLRNNCSVLESVEKDVHTAAQLGKALLARHEAYMADAERDRLQSTGRIGSLEMEKQKLEEENALKIEENRHLLDQLELLNSTLSESDTKIKSLEASLLSSQLVIRRLESSTARAEDAERHLAMLEEEQAQIFADLQNTQEDSRSHAQRCKEAQRGIYDMQDQLERMEKEAREEREKHIEIIGRMERQREVEKQLDTAAGRLKGAAASRTLGERKHGNGSSVVNHFVRDLLQDNANLQLGIAELREMLNSSHDEIESLREQLTFHQPVPSQESSAPSTLRAELEPHQDLATKLSQELHIHHHYHVTPKQEKKHKKRRPGLNGGIFTPPSLATQGTSNGQWGLISSPTAPAVLSRPGKDHTRSSSVATSTYGPYAPSELASSVPSSPRSNRHSGFFDNGYDSAAPTSPVTSFDPMSPTWRASHSKRTSAASYQSLSAIPQLDVVPGTPPNVQVQNDYFDDTILEEDEDNPPVDDAPSLMENTASTDDSFTDESAFSRDDLIFRPRLHRAHSHESIMSLSGGLDIHTLKSRPSQMTLRPLGSGEAVVTGITAVTAQPILSRATTKRSNIALRENFAGLTPRAVSGPSARQRSPSSSRSSQSSQATTAFGSVGKWVGWRPWAGSSSPNPARNTPRASEKVQEQDFMRASGINQAGAIPGFQQYWAAQRRKGAPAVVHAASVDHEALNEGLQE